MAIQEAAALSAQGQEKLEAGDAEAALADFEAALRWDPGHPTLCYNAGLAAKQLHRWDDALAHFRAARDQLDRLPDDVQNDVVWNLGIVATVVDDWTQARQAWEWLGVPLTEADPAPHGRYGLAYLQFGDDRRVLSHRRGPCDAHTLVPHCCVPWRVHTLAVHDLEPLDPEPSHPDVPVYRVLQVQRPSTWTRYLYDVRCYVPDHLALFQERMTAAGHPTVACDTDGMSHVLITDAEADLVAVSEAVARTARAISPELEWTGIAALRPVEPSHAS